MIRYIYWHKTQTKYSSHTFFYDIRTIVCGLRLFSVNDLSCTFLLHTLDWKKGVNSINVVLSLVHMFKNINTIDHDQKIQSTVFISVYDREAKETLNFHWQLRFLQLQSRVNSNECLNLKQFRSVTADFFSTAFILVVCLKNFIRWTDTQVKQNTEVRANRFQQKMLSICLWVFKLNPICGGGGCVQPPPTENQL